MAKMRIEGKEIRDADVFETVFEYFPDIIHSVDKDGNIVFTNRRASSLLGYTREELLSMNIRQIYADEILDEVEKGFNQLKKTGEKSSVESILKDKEGNRIPVEIRSFSIYDDNGNFLRTFSIIRDIHEIKELQESLIHAGRLAAIGEMAAGIVHDIKSPLQVLFMAKDVAMMSLIKMQGPKTATIQQVEKSIKDMNKALEMIKKVSDQLTNFSRGAVENFEKVDLCSIINDSLFMTQNKIKTCRVKTESDVEKGRCYTLGAPNQLQQVFVNLITNACDAVAAKNGGHLSISVSPIKRNGQYDWKCDVTDDGMGIPPGVIESVFHSFFTTKDKGKGTGLGLSISRGIISNHEGDILVRSTQGKGTTFSVILPSAQS